MEIGSVRASVRAHRGVVFALLACGFVAAQQPAPASAEPAWLATLRAHLLAHPFLGKVSLVVVADHPPFAFLVQRPPDDRDVDDYAQRTVWLYQPWLAELEQIFVTRYATPLGLQRAADVHGYAFAILASRGSYDDFARAVQAPGLHGARAHYDTELGLAVTYEDAFVQEAQREKRRAVLHEFVHALQHAYCTTRSALPAPLWFDEGLADYLSSYRGMQPEVLRTPAVDTEWLETFVTAASNPAMTPFVSGLRSLVAVEGYDQVLQAAQRRLPAGAVVLGPTREIALGTFYAEAALWMHFLHEAQDGRHRQQIQRYIGAVMRGGKGWEPFATAFEGVDVQALQDDFIAWVSEQWQAVHPRDELPGLSYPPFAAAAEPTAAAAASAPSNAFDPATLALDALQADERLAGALALATRGRLADARALLEPCRGEPRVARELDRLQALAGWRDQVLGEAAASGGALRLDVDGDTVRASAQCDADGILAVTLDGGRRLRPCDLDAACLYDLRLRTSDQPATRDWLAAYALVLHDDDLTKCKRKLRGHDEESTALADDLADYPPRRSEGEAVASLLRLGELSSEVSGEQARAALADLRATLQRHAGATVLRARRDALRDCARMLLEKSVAGEGLQALPLLGDIDVLGEDRVRVRYDFEHTSQLEDFTPADGFRAEARTDLPLEHPEAVFRIEDGELRMSGAVSRRWKLPVEAPFRIRLTASFDAGVGMFHLFACADAEGSFIYLDRVARLVVFNVRAPMARTPSARQGVYIAGQTYTFEMVHDGEQVKTLLDGKEIEHHEKSLPRRGDLVLWCQIPSAAHIDALEIETTVDADARQKAAAEYVQRELDAMFPARER